MRRIALALVVLFCACGGGGSEETIAADSGVASTADDGGVTTAPDGALMPDGAARPDAMDATLHMDASARIDVTDASADAQVIDSAQPADATVLVDARAVQADAFQMIDTAVTAPPDAAVGETNACGGRCPENFVCSETAKRCASLGGVIQIALTHACPLVTAKIEFRIFDETNHLASPADPQNVYTLAPGLTQSVTLPCVLGATLCYGARAGDLGGWGVDVDNSRLCVGCCAICGAANIAKRLECQ